MVAQNAQQQGNPTYGGVPVLVSPITAGAAAPQLSAPGAPGIPSVDTESQKATYSFTTASMLLQAAPADIFQLKGAASVVTRVKRLRTQVTSTVSGALTLQLVRRSTGSTGGTSASGSVNRYDTNDTLTASSTVITWTANPSATGTTVAALVNFIQPVNAAATPQQPMTMDFSDRNLKAICLRGALDFLVLNGSLSTLTNADNKLTCTLEFTEESTAA